MLTAGLRQYSETSELGVDAIFDCSSRHAPGLCAVPAPTFHPSRWMSFGATSSRGESRGASILTTAAPVRTGTPTLPSIPTPITYMTPRGVVTCPATRRPPGGRKAMGDVVHALRACTGVPTRDTHACWALLIYTTYKLDPPHGAQRLARTSDTWWGSGSSNDSKGCHTTSLPCS